MCFAIIAAGLLLYSATETKLIVDTSRGERLHVNVSIEPTLQLIGGTLLFVQHILTD